MSKTQVVGDPNVIEDARKAQQVRQLEAQANTASTQGVDAVPASVAYKIRPTGLALLQSMGGKDDDEPSMNAVDVRVGSSEAARYYIKVLSVREENDISNDAPRLAGIPAVLSSSQEDEAIDAMAIARCVFIDAAEGQEKEEGYEGPIYIPVFQFQEVYGQQEIRDSKGNILYPRIIGLFERKEMQYKVLAKMLKDYVYQYNPNVSPELKKMREKMMQEMAVAYVQSQR